jgi:homopolymeric O-antigen transport system permease protein
MSVVAHASSAGPAASSPLPRRPALLLSVLLDGGLAVGAYLAAYWLRFRGDQLEAFLPGAWSTLPFVMIGQLAALAAARAYIRRPRIDWLLRVIAGVAAGTIASAALLGMTIGFEGVSRSAFIADAMLLSIAALGWRGVWVLRSRAQARAGARRARSDDLIDRTAEMTTLRGVVVSLYSYRELLKNLVLKDLKLKYRGSVFGFLWSLVNPLMMIVVYTVAFTFILRIRTKGFVFYLMLGQLSWTFFASSAAMSTGAIVDNAGLLKSVLFPRAILPIGTVLFNLAQYLLTISVFLPAMLFWYQVPLSPRMLLFPLFLALQVVFTIGVALILATATAFFRDVRHLLEVALAVLFWATPILYELRQVPERFRLLILLSPVSPFLVAYQQLFFYREWPDATVWLVAGANALGAFAVGALLFLTFEDGFTEQL